MDVSVPSRCGRFARPASYGERDMIQTVGFPEPAHDIHVLYGLPGGSFYKIVYSGYKNKPLVPSGYFDTDIAVVGPFYV